MKIDYQDRIDDYLLDRMSDEERVRFEAETANDAELKEQLEYTQNVRQIIKSRYEKLALMKEWENDYLWQKVAATSDAEYRPTGSGYQCCSAPSMDESRSKFHTSRRRVFYWISGIAAMAIIGVFFFNTLNTYNNRTSDDIQDPIPYNGVPSIQYGNVAFRGGGDYQMIEKNLAEGDFETTLAQITMEEEDLNKQIDILEQKKGTEADSTEVISEKLDMLNYKQEKLLWLKVQALLGLNNKKEAILQLEKLRHSESEYKMQADSLYNILKE